MDRREFLAGSVALAALATIPAAAVGASRRRVFFTPDPAWCEHVTTVEHENSITILYERMVLWDFEADEMRVAQVGSDTYARWLAEDLPAGELPPHIGFGGCIVANPQGDPTFYERWKAFARTLA